MRAVKGWRTGGGGDWFHFWYGKGHEGLSFRCGCIHNVKHDLLPLNRTNCWERLHVTGTFVNRTHTLIRCVRRQKHYRAHTDWYRQVVFLHSSLLADWKLRAESKRNKMSEKWWMLASFLRLSPRVFLLYFSTWYENVSLSQGGVCQEAEDMEASSTTTDETLT